MKADLHRPQICQEIYGALHKIKKIRLLKTSKIYKHRNVWSQIFKLQLKHVYIRHMSLLLCFFQCLPSIGQGKHRALGSTREVANWSTWAPGPLYYIPWNHQAGPLQPSLCVSLQFSDQNLHLGNRINIF